MAQERVGKKEKVVRRDELAEEELVMLENRIETRRFLPSCAGVRIRSWKGKDLAGHSQACLTTSSWWVSIEDR